MLAVGTLLAAGVLLAYTITRSIDLNDVIQSFAPSRVQGQGPAQQELAQEDSVDVEVPEAVYADQKEQLIDPLPSETPQVAGIYAVDARLPVDAPLRGDPSARNRPTYDAVIDQFAVEENPRYSPRKDHHYSLIDHEDTTYCMTYVWDVTRALRAQIPFWVGLDGHNYEISEPYINEQGEWQIWHPVVWLSASGQNQWLNEEGPRYGWRQVSADEAQELANLGHPAVASVYERDGFGHIGLVRPGEIVNGPALAQAGFTNVNHAHVYDFFPREDTQFFVHG